MNRILKKGIFTAVIVISVICMFGANSFAIGMLLNYDGAVHKYTGSTCKLEVNGSVLNTSVPPIILNNRTLVPVRDVFEKLDATVKWDAQAKKVYIDSNTGKLVLTINDVNAVVDGKIVKMDVPAKIINTKTFIPVRFVAESLNMKVGWSSEKCLVTINSNDSSLLNPTNPIMTYSKLVINQTEKVTNTTNTSTNTGAPIVTETKPLITETKPIILDTNSVVLSRLKGVSSDVYGKNDKLIINLDSKVQYSIIDSLSNKLIIDFANTQLLGGTTNSLLDGKSVSAVRCGQYKQTVARVVVNTKEQSAGYKIFQIDNQIIVLVGNNILDSDVTEINGKINMSTVISRGSTNKNSENIVVDPLNLSHVSKEDHDEIIIGTSGYKTNTVTFVDDPYKIVVDVKRSGYLNDEGTIPVQKSEIVKSLKYTQLSRDTVRVYIDLYEIPKYRIMEQEGQLVVNMEKTSYKNIVYRNRGSLVQFVLKGGKLTDGAGGSTKLYEDSYDNNANKYKLTFQSSLIDVGKGTMILDDGGLISSVQIYTDLDTNLTTLLFSATGKYDYKVVSRPDLGDTLITVLKQASKTDKLVFIDAGHGGTEPGAIYGGVNEKDLNLDIAKRLNAILKSKNIKTYMSREDDSTVDLYDRPYTANDLNATLFVCIHNNACDSPDAKGTETLYYVKESTDAVFNSQRFAQIVEDKLISILKTQSRGIVERPNLVVLNSSIMPAVLAEIGFITNNDDLTNLKSEVFRQKVAEALSEGILQALAEVN